MFKTEKMVKANFIIHDKYEDFVSKELLKTGIIHFTGISRTIISEDNLNMISFDIPLNLAIDLRKKIDSFLLSVNYSQIKINEDYINDFKAFDIKEIEDKVNQYSTENQYLKDKQKNLQHEIIRLEELLRYLENNSSIEVTIDIKKQFQYLGVKQGKIQNYTVDLFKNESVFL